MTIEGGYKLNGTVRISGAKNATVALIPAAVLSDGPVEILGVPEISDVEALAILLEELKCKVEVDGERIRIDPTHMEDIPLVSDAVNKLRASYYFMGALLGKYKRVKIKMPGGCYLGPRPIDLHLKGFEALGAKITYENDTYLLEAEELVGTSIYLDFASVGATINIMLAAVRAKGKTIIENAAKEPEIIDVAKPDTQLLNDGRRALITQEYTVTSFDSALYYLPPMEVTVDNEKYRSKALALKVYSVNVPLDPENPEQFFGPKTVMQAPFAWEDWYGLMACGALIIPIDITCLSDNALLRQ